MKIPWWLKGIAWILPVALSLVAIGISTLVGFLELSRSRGQNGTPRTSSGGRSSKEPIYLRSALFAAIVSIVLLVIFLAALGTFLADFAAFAAALGAGIVGVGTITGMLGAAKDVKADSAEKLRDRGILASGTGSILIVAAALSQLNTHLCATYSWGLNCPCP